MLTSTIGQVQPRFFLEIPLGSILAEPIVSVFRLVSKELQVSRGSATMSCFD